MNNQSTPINAGGKESEHRKRLSILENHLGSEYYRTGEFHNNISNAMEEYAQQFQPSELNAVRSKEGYEGGWIFEPEWLRQLTEKINEIDHGDSLSMEEVEAVLIGIDYQPPSPPQEQGDAVEWSRLRKDFSDILYDANGTGSGAEDIVDFLKSKYQLFKAQTIK